MPGADTGASVAALDRRARRGIPSSPGNPPERPQLPTAPLVFPPGRAGRRRVGQGGLGASVTVADPLAKTSAPPCSPPSLRQRERDDPECTPAIRVACALLPPQPLPRSSMGLINWIFDIYQHTQIDKAKTEAASVRAELAA